MRLRSDEMKTCSRWCSNDDPSYQDMFSLRCTTLSPLSAEIGIEVRSVMSSLVAKARNSSQIRSKTAWS